MPPLSALELEPEPMFDHPQQEGGTVLPQDLPAGWRWYGSPEAHRGFIVIDERHVAWIGPASGGRATYADRMEALRAWAEEHNLFVRHNRSRDLDFTEHEDGSGWTAHATQTYRLEVSDQRNWEYNYGRGALDWFHAEQSLCECGERHPVWAHRCPQSGLPRSCQNCGGHTDIRHEAGRWFCGSCSWRCEDCDALTPPNHSYCSDCREVNSCTNCSNSEWLEEGEDTTYRDGLCERCFERRCTECGTISRHPLQWSPSQDRYLCRGCHRTSLGDSTEAEDDNDGDTAGITPIPGREQIRMCGIELEGARGTGDGSTLAMALYRAGLASHNSVQGYHHGGSSFIHVENDSTVDWEMVIGPVNTADPAQMVAVNSAMRIVRAGIKAGTYKLDLRCGLHIHVGAERFSLASAYNLNTLFSYVEDVMFRLAAAKWPVHRSMSGAPYCQPVHKAGSKLAFGREVGMTDDNDARRVALNFRNYFQRMLGNCRCGAVKFDSWEDCTCDMGKCTFEFRLFNSTANPRKLHAYLALAQALVAKAGSIPEIETPEEDFPVQAFLPKPVKGMNDNERVQSLAEWQPRLRWLLTELPLTDDERGSVMYCIRNSDLAELGEDFLNELFQETQEVPA